MKSSLPLFSVLALLLLASPVLAQDGSRRHARRDLRELASQITGGASLLADTAPSRTTRAFHERAQRFEESLRQRGRVKDDWRELRSAFEAARRSGGQSYPRTTFLMTHLQEDLAEGDALIAAHASAPPPAGGDAPGAPRHVSFVDRETCIGTGRSGKPCPSPQQDLTFRIPRDVAVITHLDGEWRDYGRPTSAEIYVNDRLVWRSVVNAEWDADGEAVNVRIPPGSTLTIRSATGDPIWIRRLTAETLATARPGAEHRDPWDFRWQD
jgi:hypothetical protein